MDKFFKLARQAQTAVVILGNGSTFEFTDPERITELCEREDFVGVVRIVNGVPDCALAVPLDEITVKALSQAFVQRIEDAIIAFERIWGKEGLCIGNLGQTN